MKQGRMLALSLGLAASLSVLAVQRWQKVPPPQPTTLFADLGAITAIELENKHGRMRAQRTGHHWHITQPVQTAADAEAIAAFLEQVRAAPLRTVGEVDPALSGLAAPRFRLRLECAGGVAAADFGAPNQYGDELYVRVAGATGLTSGNLAFQLERNLYQWREKRLLRFGAADVREIRVANAVAIALRPAVAATGANATSVRLPDEMPLELPRVAGLLVALGNLRAQRFVEEVSSLEELQKSGLARPTIELELRLADGNALATWFWRGPTCTAAVVPRGPIVELMSCRMLNEIEDFADWARR